MSEHQVFLFVVSGLNAYFSDRFFFSPKRFFLFLCTRTSPYGKFPLYGLSTVGYLSFFFGDNVICNYLEYLKENFSEFK